MFINYMSCQGSLTNRGFSTVVSLDDQLSCAARVHVFFPLFHTVRKKLNGEDVNDGAFT